MTRPELIRHRPATGRRRADGARHCLPCEAGAILGRGGTRRKSTPAQIGLILTDRKNLSPAARAGLSGGRTPRVVVFYWGALMAGANGSQIRTLGLLSWLSGRFNDVVLYTYANHPTDPWTEDDLEAFAIRFPRVRLVRDTESPALKLLSRAKKVTVTLFPSLARRAYAFGRPGLTPNYAALRRETGDPVYVVNYVDGLAQLNGVDPDRAMVETHDVRFFRRAKGKPGPVVGSRSLLALRYEGAALSAAQVVVAITENEAYFYRNLLPGADVRFVPEYAPAEPVPAGSAGAFEYDLLFAASGNDINVRGLCDLYATEGGAMGRFRVAMCGRICDRAEVRALAGRHPSIELLGFVPAEELERLHAATRACLSPTDGTGLNIKLVEALRHRKPVFASRSSRAGLSAGWEGCVFPADPETMVALLRDPAALEAASQAAAAYYRRFTRMGERDALGRTLSSWGGGAGPRPQRRSPD